LIGTFLYLPAHSEPERQIDQTRLPQILAEAASYCWKFGNATLNYVCLEDVTEVIYSPYKKIPRSFNDILETGATSRYLYDYQLIKKDQDIQEQRILLEDNGRKTEIKDAPLMVKRFKYRHIILGPMLLNEYWQPLHDYRIVGSEKVKGEFCLVIQAVPKPSTKLSHLFGKIWVSERDYKVWRLEWYQESLDNYELAEETAKILQARPQLKMTMEYGFEEKGIRFPSKCVFSEEYLNIKGVIFIRSVTTVVYKNYKFFTVETEVQVKKSP
jgi:hypothetical protein